MKISIVVPVYNETGNIIPLLVEIEASMKNAVAYEIIFVDDGSEDETGIVLQDAMQQFTHLRVIRHEQSCGQSTAIYSGVRAARYSWIATLDGDGQNDPADIPYLYDVFKRQQQMQTDLWMVAGWRKKRMDSKWRLFSSKFANSVRCYLLNDYTPDTGCGLKLFLREKFLLLPYFNHMHRFLPALVIRAGGRVISEPVNHRPRNSGQSKYGTMDRLWAGIIDMMGVIWLINRSKRPVCRELSHE